MIYQMAYLCISRNTNCVAFPGYTYFHTKGGAINVLIKWNTSDPERWLYAMTGLSQVSSKDFKARNLEMYPMVYEDGF